VSTMEIFTMEILPPFPGRGFPLICFLSLCRSCALESNIGCWPCCGWASSSPPPVTEALFSTLRASSILWSSGFSRTSPRKPFTISSWWSASVRTSPSMRFWPSWSGAPCVARPGRRPAPGIGPMLSARWSWSCSMPPATSFTKALSLPARAPCAMCLSIPAAACWRCCSFGCFTVGKTDGERRAVPW
jgi:hypothetical protein